MASGSLPRDTGPSVPSLLVPESQLRLGICVGEGKEPIHRLPAELTINLLTRRNLQDELIGEEGRKLGF